MSSDRCIIVFNWSFCFIDLVLDLNLRSILQTPDRLIWNMLSYFSMLNNFADFTMTQGFAYYGADSCFCP